MRRPAMQAMAAAGMIVALLAGCGGGGGGGGNSAGAGAGTGTGSSGIPYVAGQYLPSQNFAAKCETPRSGTDPVTNVAYPDTQGTTADENFYLRSWTHELYLWFDQVPDLNPNSYTTTASFFPLLITSATTASGAAVDRFHFTYATSTWESLEEEGEEAGYGVQFDIIAATAPRNITVAFVDPAATGSAATLARGAVVQNIDGVDINDDTQSGVDTLNAGLQPATSGESHTFIVLDQGSSTPRTVTLVSSDFTETPVPLVTSVTANGAKVGYILFNDHIATAESELVQAFTTLQSQGVQDLVLDIRYNGGGLLDIASEVAYMVAGSAQTSGHTFELQQFNSQYPTTNPVTGGALTPTLFHSQTQGFSLTAGQALPSLNLTRVFILTGAETCSASESIINSLRGVNVQVILIGSTTCGKPYGFYPQDNCGTTYFSIEFRGVNDQGFGDYPAGFSPANTVDAPGVTVPGCSVADDFTHALGSASEAQFSEALAYRAGGACTVTPTGSSILASQHARAPGGLAITGHSPLRDNRILRL